MSLSRVDSLAVKLQRAGLFQEYFSWCAQEGPTFQQRLDWLEKHGHKCSRDALSRLHRSPEAGCWRRDEAVAQSRSFAESLPEDLSTKMKQALIARRFNEVLGEMSHDQLMDHLQVEHDTEMLKLKERAQKLKERMDPAKIRLAERRVELLEKAAQKAKETLNQVVTKGGISKDTRKLIEDAMAGLTS